MAEAIEGTRNLLKPIMDTLFDKSYVTWEKLWAPYDQSTYDTVLQSIQPGDTVLEIGAGDLRLSWQVARIARKVFAIEIHPEIIHQARSASFHSFPDNLEVVCGDACEIPYPSGVTVGILLMRHCTHFSLYASKLKAIGCKALVTNARWRMGVEVVDLQKERVPFEAVKLGWYACWCGATGFVTGPAEAYTPELDQRIAEVSACPACAHLLTETYRISTKLEDPAKFNT
ncbi:MAG TPA: methyltransferase domain-containing protein [Longilinea sp.]|nr:methyltransferase domain-containing protein [Longilinea sp.]